MEPDMKIKAQAMGLGLVVTLLSANSKADFWSDLRDSAGDVGTAAWRYTTAPVESMINGAKVITEGASASTIVDPYQRLGMAAGDAIEGGYSLARQPEQFITAKVQKYSQKWGGDAGGFVFDLSTFSSRLMSDLAQSSVNASANVLRGQNPLQISAAPLAAAIRSARDVHAPNAHPLPEDVRIGLAGFFSEATLSRAKWTVGTVQITLPNLFGGGNRMMGDGFAVVVDNIIVFNEYPPEFTDDNARHWWVHEITHVAQYRDMGVEKFAWEYLRDLGRNIEGEADNLGAAFIKLDSNGVHMASLAMEQRSAAIDATRHAVTSGPMAKTYGPIQEYFVVICHFPGDMYPVTYFVTNYGKIIVRNNVNGQTMQIGWATPGGSPDVAWVYRTNFVTYSVTPDGRIMGWNPQYRTPWQVGHTQQIAMRP